MQACHPALQYTLRLSAPSCAIHALPGSFVHLQCDPMLPMRRPFSIMRVEPNTSTIDLLYKVVGEGTRRLAQQGPGARLSVIGPIGRPFTVHPQYPRTLLLGGGIGIPPMIFLADRLRRDRHYRPLAILGSEIPFPFTPIPSKIIIPGVPAAVIAAMPLLEDWGVASRLTTRQDLAGCYEGFVTDLARLWLASLPHTLLDQVELFACGPHAMLEACARLAFEFKRPCQVALEEYMACAVGGCAGCAVEVHTPQGPMMKRVCVDGPVFTAREIFSHLSLAGRRQ